MGKHHAGSLVEETPSETSSLSSETSSLTNNSEKKEIHLPEIVRRYSEGVSIKTLAAEYDVARMTIYRWMLSALGEGEYESVVTSALIARIAEADQELDDSRDNVAVTRAYAKCRLTRQDFERRRPKLYGQKQELEIDKTVHVHVHRDQTPQPVDPAGRVVDVTPKAVEDKGSSTP
jgi:hypothetical protein